MNLIEEIKRKIKIVDLASELKVVEDQKQSGNNYNFYFSPKLNEQRTGSMRLFPETESFFDYGTTTGGDVIQFYEYCTGRNTKEAVHDLAMLFNVEVEKGAEYDYKPTPIEMSVGEFVGERILKDLNTQEMDLFKSVLQKDLDSKVALDAATKKELERAKQTALIPIQKQRIAESVPVFHDLAAYCFDNYSKDEHFLHYLIKERAISPEMIRRFYLFMIGNYYQVSNHLKKKWTIERLQRAGIFNDDGNFIFYKHRLIIPNLYNNQIVHMRGRYLDEDGNANGDGAKYLAIRNDAVNSFNPKRFFNIDVTKKMFAGENLHIVEGEFDTIAITGEGLHSISIMAVHCVPAFAQWQKIKKFNLILCMDNDEAGNGLLNRLRELFKKLNKPIKIKAIPKGKDANDFIKKYKSFYD